MKNDVTLFDDASLYTQSLGCNSCILKETCGGLHVKAPLFSCDQHCRCTALQSRTCSRACLRNPVMYVQREREVNGWQLDLPRSMQLPLGRFPLYVPIIKDGGKRRLPCGYGSIALRMDKLFRRRDGKPNYADRTDLARRMKVPDNGNIFITAVGIDDYLERLWESRQRRDLFSWIATLKPSLVTSPNFSLFSDAVRTEDLYNMKRIAICWYEMAEAGVPTALHINARTDRDWQRWREFIAVHPEINAISFEFGTGAGQRRPWYLKQLTRLAHESGRTLTLVLRGGRPQVPALLRAFDQVVSLSTNAFVPAMNRQVIVESDGKLEKKPWDGDGAGWLDVLLETNIAAEAGYFNRMHSEFRPRQPR